MSSKENQRLAVFSPLSDKIAFVYENNLFIKDLITDNELQVTNDGLKGSIINGGTDWVYEEELDLIQAFQWSPDEQNLAYYRFDESKVKEYEFPVYDSLYPTVYKYKYPKAGEANSVIDIFVYNLKNKTYKTMETGSDKDIYLPRIKWTNDANLLSIMRMNRLQNKIEILFADINTGKSRVIYTEENKYYIDVPDNLQFLRDNKQFILTSQRDGYNHIYLFNTDNSQFKQVTKGSWDVEEIKGFDEKNKTVYYTSSDSSPLERDLYSIRTDGTDKKKLSTPKGSTDAEFSKSFKYYISYFSDSNIPPYISVNNNTGKELRMLEDNKSLAEKIKDYNFK